MYFSASTKAKLSKHTLVMSCQMRFKERPIIFFLTFLKKSTEKRQNDEFCGLSQKTDYLSLPLRRTFRLDEIAQEEEGENGLETWASIARLTIRKICRSNTCIKLLSHKIHPAPDMPSLFLQSGHWDEVVCHFYQIINDNIYSNMMRELLNSTQ